MSNEPSLELLALLSRPQLSEAQVQRTALMLQEVDFPSLLQHVFHHRIDGCCYCNVRDHFAGLVPQECLIALTAKYKESASRMLQQFHALSLIKCNFHKAGIPVVTLKGIPLAERLYGDLAKRYSKDIDLLIAPEDHRRAHAALTNMGWNAESIEGLSDQQRLLGLKKQKDVIYHKGSINLELHLRLTPQGGEIEELATKFLDAAVDFDSFEFQVLQFVYLCWHANISNFHRIKWLTDIALIMEAQGSADFYEAVLSVGKKYAVEWDVLICIQLAGKLFGVQVNHMPENDIVGSRKFNFLLGAAIKGMNNLDKYRMFRTSLYNLTYRFLKSTSWKDRFRLLVWVFRPNHVDVQVIGKLAGGSTALYYLLRPFTFFYRRIAALIAPK